MLQVEKCESMEERMEPLLSPLPNKLQYLNQFIQQFYSYQALIQSASRLFLAYLIAHLICLLASNLFLKPLLTNLALASFFLFLPEVVWAITAFLFKKLLLVEDPHSLGQKRIKLIVKTKPIQVISINLLTVTVLLLARSLFVSRNYYMFAVDIFLILLSFRIILQIYNKQERSKQSLRCLRQRNFYVVPALQVQFIEEPFEIHANHTEKSINANQKVAKSPFKKYFKSRRKIELQRSSEQLDIQCQLYSH